MSATATSILLHSKSYAEAEAIAEKLVDKGALTDEAALEALESHPGKPNGVHTENGVHTGKTYTTKEAVLAALAAKEIDVDKAMEELARFDTPRAGGLYCKVTPKGCVGVYGINSQMPVSLYIDQWERLFGFREQVEAFIKANEGKEHTVPQKDKNGKVIGTVKVTLSRKAR